LNKNNEEFGEELGLVLKGNDDEIFLGKFGVFVFSKK